MSVQDLKKAVAKLSPQKRAEFRKWFDVFEADEWDRQIEADRAASRLDHLIEQSRLDYKSGNGREL